MAVADELVTILGVDIAKNAMAKLESFKNGVDSVKNTLVGLSVVITGAAATMGLMVKGAADEAAELEKLSSKTGLSTDALQEWGYAAKQAGGDSKSLQNDLAALQQKFGGTGKSAEKMLLSLADRMKGMSGSQAQNLGKAWGLSDDTIALLRKGRDGIEELRKEAHKLGGIIPADSLKRAADFKKQLGELQYALHGLTSQVAIAMIPALSRIVEIFTGWMASNREWISLGLEALMGGIVAGFERFWTVLKQLSGIFDPLIDAIQPLLGDFEMMEWVTHLVTGALTGLLIVFSPLIAKLLLIVAAVTAAALLFEDFFTYLEGGDSVIGDLLNAFAERWPELFAALRKVGEFIRENFIVVVQAAWDVIKAVFGATGEILGQVLDGFNAMAGPVDEFFETFAQKFPALFNALQKFGEFVKKSLIGAFETAVEKIKALVDYVLGLLKSIGSAIGKVMEGANWIADKLGFGDDKKDGPPTPSTMPVHGQPAQMQMAASHGQQGSQYNDNKQVNIHVATSDPQQAGQAAAAAINQGQPPATPGIAAPAY